MPDKLLEAEDLTCPSAKVPPSLRLPDDAWLPVLQHPCDFSPDIFEAVSLNLIKNPNNNSSLLFRADVLYDSQNDELTEAPLPEQELREALQKYIIRDGELGKYHVRRTILRRMIPRNPQLDKPTLQTCVFLASTEQNEDLQQSLVVYIPHSATCEELPWYHPRVQYLAYLHSWNASPQEQGSQGTISLHYRLYPSEQLPLAERLLRTGQHLLTTLYKHGQGTLTGYEKRVHHDQLVSQQRVQDTYTELKRRHANRLCDNWVEQTEPSKHVFEDLGIAAFLMELWRDMYWDSSVSDVDGRSNGTDARSPFQGFVDIGCGNGVLVDVLIREGYQGWGFDARRRKTWSTFEPPIQEHLKELLLIPQPLFELQQVDLNHSNSANGSILFSSGQPSWHNGIFPPNTFIISNHADELTSWTPLLASLSSSPFLAIPCCSHNLSGSRFRAPSVFNTNSADTFAPSFFAAHVNRSKYVPIAIARPDNNYGIPSDNEHEEELKAEEQHVKATGPETGDLTKQSQKARAKQPSAYSSLCDWVAHLCTQVGYVVEKEMLRLPSTRNVGIVGRAWKEGFAEESMEARMARVMAIARLEKADGEVWMKRAKGLEAGGGKGGEH